MKRAWALAGVLGLGLGMLVGCIPEDDGGGGGLGPACREDADCVPNDCCGVGTRFVYKTLAPSCGAKVCDGSCPVDQVNCGCGIAHCSNSECVTAVNPDCGG